MTVVVRDRRRALHFLRGRHPPRLAGGRRGRHIAALIIGVLALIPGLSAVAGGTTALIAQGVRTDGDGHFVEVIDGIAEQLRLKVAAPTRHEAATAAENAVG